MKRTYLLLIVSLLVLSCTTDKKEVDSVDSKPIPTEEPSALYELRTYYAANGKLENLLSRFRDHTMNLFEKHGMTNVAYWVPIDNKENTLVYLMVYPSREARNTSWKNFISDPDWIEVWEASKIDGALVDSISQKFLTTTDFSPELKIEEVGDRVFEMRTYYTNPGKLSDLHARFRDHTMTLFEKHGITNIAYFQFEPDMEGSDNTLLYLITHSNAEVAKNNWRSFVDDPDWRSAFEASRINGPLVDSLTSVYMTPTDFSPIK